VYGGWLVRFLVVHLSDIHIESSRDPVLSRVEEIVSAVQNLDYELDTAVIALTGDIAARGFAEEYEAAATFISGIRARLSTARGPDRPTLPVFIVAVPGNHDCDFSGDQEVRESVLATIAATPAKTRQASLVTTCTSIQTNFRSFMGKVGAQTGTETGTGYHPDLASRVDIPVSGQTLTFIGCNTAWLSQRREVQGSLFFPSDALPNSIAESSVVVAMFHHPYKWLEAVSTRAFQKSIDRAADIILTGHEHDPSRRLQQVDSGERNEYIEAGPLQIAASPETSIFNALVVDTAVRKVRFFRLSWDGIRYTPLNPNEQTIEPLDVPWQEFRSTRLRSREAYTPTDQMEDLLNDPGVALTHRKFGPVGLNDFYIPLDLAEVTFESRAASSLISGHRLDSLLQENPNLLVLGDSQSGKTVLAKKIFRLLQSQGRVPILISLSEMQRPLSPTEQLFRQLTDAFKDQYIEPSPVDYQQLAPARRAVIIDDYDKLVLNHSQKRRFHELLEQFADTVILLADDLSIDTRELIERAAGRRYLDRFRTFRILSLSKVRRDDLVEQWLALDPEFDPDQPDHAYEMARLGRSLDTLIGKNFVPSYPVFLLAVLQAHEASMATDLRASAHAYFYELLIKAALSRGQSHTDFDIARGYLSYLAYRMYVGREADFDIEQMKTVHSEYQDRYDIRNSFDRVLDTLLSHEMLVKKSERYSFRYPYLYYYFVASFLNDHIGDDETKLIIKQLSRRAYIEEFANILLFLTHLSKDPFILREMLSAARDLFPNEPHADLSNDSVAFVRELAPQIRTIVFGDGSVRESRRALREAQDVEHDIPMYDDRQLEALDPASAILDPLVELNAAVKTMQILGQVLKNFPGTLEGLTKLDLARSCYGIGLRCLNSMLSHVRDNRADVLEWFVDITKQNHPRFNEEELQRRATETIIGITECITFGMIQRISGAIGAPGLEVTYDRMLQEAPTNAVRLVDISLMLDHVGRIPQDRITTLAREVEVNPLALTVLRYLVVQHFQLFPVEPQVKQRLCQALDMPYERLQGANPSRLLLSPGQQK
jgi:predicted MPP superfamily phosphohydrolase